MANRVYVYIDGSNFYKACKADLGRADVKLGEFAKKLVGQREHRRTYYYNVPLSREHPQVDRDGQQKFFNALARTPYLEVRLGRLVKRTWHCRSCGEDRERWTEKGVDMRIGVDLVSDASADLYDVAVLVSGDGDFEYRCKPRKTGVNISKLHASEAAEAMPYFRHRTTCTS